MEAGFSQIQSQFTNLLYNFNVTCTHLKSSKWGSGCQSTEMNHFLPENSVILLLLIFKRLFVLFVWKLIEHSDTTVTTH